MKKFIAATCAAVLLTASPAQAAVTFDTTTGTGFVGKGDLQLAFGWNNAQFQANYTKVDFRYEDLTEYDAVCEWQTGPVHNRKDHKITVKTTVGVSESVQAEGRQRNQITGINLLGFGDSESEAEGGEDLPVVGGQCKSGEGNTGTYTSVTPGTSSGGVLQASIDNETWVDLQ